MIDQGTVRSPGICFRKFQLRL